MESGEGKARNVHRGGRADKREKEIWQKVGNSRRNRSVEVVYIFLVSQFSKCAN